MQSNMYSASNGTSAQHAYRLSYMRSFLPIRIFDNWVHEQDIRRAVGRPGHFAGPVAEHALERVARAMSFVVGCKVRPSPDTTVVFEVTGPLGRTLALGMEGERAMPLDPPPAVPTVG